MPTKDPYAAKMAPRPEDQQLIWKGVLLFVAYQCGVWLTMVIMWAMGMTSDPLHALMHSPWRVPIRLFVWAACVLMATVCGYRSVRALQFQFKEGASHQ